MEIHFLFDLLPYIAGRFPAVNVLSGINNGKRFFFNTEQYMNASAGIAGFLIEEGLQKGECVLSISENCPEWNFVDMGVMLAGGIHVPVSPSLCDKELAHIIAQTEARIVFVSGKFVLRRLQNLPDSIGKISEIVSFNRIDGVQCLEDIIHLNKANQFKNLASNQKSISHPDDIATIIYTSGSTGMPKGVMLSHKNLAAGLLSTNDFFGLEPSAKIMSYLPLSHSFERWMNYVYQFSGITVCYADYGSSIISNLKEIQPDAVATVPLFLEKIYEQINASLANSEHAMNPSEQKSLIHEFLGNNLKMLFTAGAALSKKLFDYFTGMDIPVYEIYGSSETMVIAFNFRKNVRQGSVGKIKRGCRIKLSSLLATLMKM